MAAAGASPFGAMLRRHRLAAGLTQEALAEAAGLSPKAVSDLERDSTRTPRLGTVALLADALGLTAERRADLLTAARPGQTQVAAPHPEQAPSVMPRPLTPLVGRGGVVAALVEVLGRDHLQLLALTGPGGVGKTRVAIEVARRTADRFSDGSFFVDLAPLRDPALVLSTIAQRLGVDERDGTPLHDRLVTSLRPKQLLLLLDNFEPVVGAGQAVLALLEECPGLVALVTSRVALHLRGGREYPIAPLALPEATDRSEMLVRSPAVELFVERARAAGTDLPTSSETAVAVAEICRRLEGLPLAIELAAARVRLLPPPALLARLDKRLPLLVGGPRDLPARQKTMRDAIAWSYELLEASEQALFRRVCVFAGGCTLDAAELVCRQWPEALPVADGVATLVSSSLLQVTEAPPDDAPDPTERPRVVVLETIREYGLEQLEAHGETSGTRQLHATYYLALAERAEQALGGSDTAPWLARLDREHDNVRAALRWAHERRDGVTALRLAGALWRFWQWRGHLSEGRSWLGKALELASTTTAVSGSVRVNALVGAAMLAIDQAAYEEAADYCSRAASVAGEQAVPSDLIVALNVQGLLAREQARYADSARDYEQALALARAVEDRRGEVTALLGLAHAAMFAGDVARGSVLAQESLAVARQLGDNHLLARAILLVAWQAANTGSYEQAEVLSTEALGLLGTLGDTGQYAEVLFLLGTVALFRADYERAAGYFEDSLTFNRSRGDERLLATDLGGLASAALNLGDLGRARALAEESLALARRYGDLWSVAMGLTLLGHVDLAEGHHGRAQERLAEAATLFQGIGNPIYLPWCLEGLVGVAAAHGYYERAAELDGACEAVRREVGVCIPPIHRTAHARTLARARNALSRETFEAAREAGGARPPEHTIAAALSDKR